MNTTLDNVIKSLDTISRMIDNDTYTLTRDDRDSVAWRIIDLKKYICDLYAIRCINKQ